MARKTITHYGVFHDIGGKTSINVHYQGGGRDLITGLSVPEARHVIDLLRNERPMTYDAERRRLSTMSPEPVGEEE